MKLNLIWSLLLILPMTAKADEVAKTTSIPESERYEDYARQCAQAIHWLRDASSAPNEAKNDYPIAANRDSIVVFDNGGGGDAIVYTNKVRSTRAARPVNS